jgi:hypothetical protein
MTLEQIFCKERERYIQHLARVRDHIAKERGNAACELLISLNVETLPYPYRYLRADVVCKLGDGTTKISAARMDLDPEFEGTGFSFDELVVEVYPFTWDTVHILFNKHFESVGPVDEWITRWLDIGDKNPRDKLGLGGAIHSFTQVEQFKEWSQLTGDLGSAPVEALVEFVNLLAKEGATKIIIQSSQESV